MSSHEAPDQARGEHPGTREADSVVTLDGEANPALPRWREDFPVDLTEDQYVARRDFTKFMVLTSFAFVVGQVWIGARNFVRSRRGQPAIVKICDIAQMRVGTALRFMYPDANSPCLLIRRDEHTFVAYDQKCTHLTCAVQPDLEQHRLRCPCHHGYFDLASGRPVAGPPRRPLPRVTLEMKAGAIYATGIQESLA